MSKLVEHAIEELRRCGQYDEDPAYSQSIISAIASVASYGHSGGSMFAAIDQLTALLRFENLAPLTDNPDEWNDVSEMSGGVPLWQNNRNSKMFSSDGGKTYYSVDDDVNDGEDRPIYTSEAHK